MTRARNQSIFVPQGPPGPEGPPGPAGEDGNMLFTFEIVDGNLILTYADGIQQPNFSIDANGHLIYTF